MHLPTHAALTWLLAESDRTLERRDRRLILVSGVIPDLDALTLLGGREVYERWHRIVCHNALGAVVATLLLAFLARRRAKVALLCFLGFHGHLLCDLIGSAGPDGSNWGIPYLVPFVNDPERQLRWDGQWGLASWQNVALTIGALLVGAHLAAARGRSIVEAFSLRADAAVVEVVRRRWPFGRGAAPTPPANSP